MATRIMDLTGERPLQIGLLAGTILVILAIQAFYLLNFNINWDEFLFLSLVFEYSAGTLSKSLQTFHVHLFSWMTGLDRDEIQLTLLGRGFMLFCELATLGFIYSISRKFVRTGFALFAVLAYLASGFVLMQGTSFRADPMITSLLMAAIYLLMEKSDRPWKDIAASVSIGLAFVISIKSVFYAPAILGALIWRTRHSTGMEHRIRLCIGLFLGVSVSILVFYFWHRSTLAPVEAKAVTRLNSVFSRVLLDIPFWPQRQYFLSWITASWPQALLIFSGISLLWSRQSRESTSRLTVSLLFALPILSIFFYRNAFPYFYPFIVASSMISVAIGGQAVAESVSRVFSRTLLTSIVIYMFVYTLGQSYLYSFHHQTGQRETISLIHEMFPQPTPYIDRNSMIASYPKCGFFMSSWGMEKYRETGKPVFSRVLDECEPKFLIANSYQLKSALYGNSSEANPYLLLDEDARLLKSNFIHHWGAIWVAGKNFDLDGRPTSFQIPVAGIYTVESPAQIILDEQQYGDGDYLFLSKGSHVIESTPQQVELRYGRHLPRPGYPPSSPIYYDFLWNVLNMLE
ncbi:MAG: glycosyltransferase family 39 protein [Gammaproteobacteria bacterium]|jgi:hypothetical protein